ncbi:tryptophanase [Candidatus Dojkabacteria bacterium]|nr:tryptophanase [Candidatus Dojkabacteria bacterium]
MKTIKFHKQEEDIPLELHKPVIVQSLNLQPIDERLKALEGAGFNTFLLNTKNIFLDMLTDSGTNAMSNEQLASMMRSDEAYAGSQSFDRLEESVNEFFNTKFFLPVHQGRAAEHIISRVFVKEGDTVPMNFHFTTTRAHIELAGGRVEELIVDEVFNVKSDHPFKGNMDIKKLEESIKKHDREKIPFIRMEVTTNLTGGQPVSLKNLRAVKEIAKKHDIMLVIDACLIAENAWFISQREDEFKDSGISEIIHEMSDLADIVYFSARKLGAVRGGGIVTNRKDLFDKMKDMVPLFEGFFTYGGMSTKEIEALAVGLREFQNPEVIGQMPQFIQFVVDSLDKEEVPVITPGGGLGVHIEAGQFLPYVNQSEYPAGALAAALFLVSGVRAMERGTISNDRDPDTGEEILADLELIRMAVPRRVFTLSQMKFLVDRILWLQENKELIGGLKFVEEPPVLRFFAGRLEPAGDWPKKLAKKFKADFGESL